MKNKILNPLLRTICVLTIGFALSPVESYANIGEPVPDFPKASCEGAAGHCITYGDVVYFGKLIVTMP